MRVRPLLVLACLAATAVGCGGDKRQAAQRPAPPVELAVTVPSDLAKVEDETVEVRGTVKPAGAAVLVLGQRAVVSGGGSFSATVPLEPGDNVIDVMASAAGRSPALTAVRVEREVLVTVPDLGSKKVEEVEDVLEPLGLQPQVDKQGGLFEELLPGEPAVCTQEPAAGARLRRGAKVRVVVSKSC